MADKVKICALGGLDEKGRDCYVVEINDDIFVLDCGSSLPDKSLPGVDCLIPNPEYLIANKNRVKAFLITHGHDESMSGVKYFADKIPAPIYCNRHTRISMENQAAIHHVKTKMNFVEVNASDTVIIANHEVRFFQVPHNFSNSSGVAIWTDRGWIVYTSDFIVDFSVNEPDYFLDLKALESIASKQTLIMLAESKAVNRSGYCSPKHRAKGLIEKYFRDANKRIFINTFWQNAYRLQEIVKLCVKYDKKIYPYDGYARKIIEIYKESSPTTYKNAIIVEEQDLLRVRSQDMVIIMLGQGDEIYEEMQDLSSGKNDDRRIVLGEDDIFINAALPLQMQETLATRAVDAIYRTGAKVVWLKGKDVSSMHAQKDDLKFILSLLRPKYYLPVRGNFVNMMTNAKLALNMEIGLNHMNVFIMDNGMQLVFDEAVRPHIVPANASGINASPVLVDGNGLTQGNNAAIEERVKMSEDGVVIIASTVSLAKKKIVAGPDCQMRGFVYVKEAEPLLKSITNIYVDEINTRLTLPIFNEEEAKEAIKERAKRFIKRENGREPFILPIIQIIKD